MRSVVYLFSSCVIQSEASMRVGGYATIRNSLAGLDRPSCTWGFCVQNSVTHQLIGVPQMTVENFLRQSLVLKYAQLSMLRTLWLPGGQC